MYKEPKEMQEIHEIRVKMYEEMKNMTPAERVAEIHREAQEAIKKYGLTFRKHKKAA